jgi:hypothetical protein
LFALFGTAYIATLAIAVFDLLRRAPLKDLMPTLLIICSQSLWFLVPLFAMRFGLFQETVALSTDHAVYAFFWVAIAHAIQYLWITSYFAINTGAGATLSGVLGKALSAGALIWVIPVVLFSPSILGNQSYYAGLSILVAAAVNVHHFLLDGAIWKLREGRIAAVLLRKASPQAASHSSSSNSILKNTILAVGVLCVIAHYMGTTSLSNASRALEIGDLDTGENAMTVLSILQRDNADLRQAFAQEAIKQQDFARAREWAAIAADLVPSEKNKDFLVSVENRAQGAAGVLDSNTILPVAPYSPKLSR